MPKFIYDHGSRSQVHILLEKDPIMGAHTLQFGEKTQIIWKSQKHNNSTLLNLT